MWPDGPLPVEPGFNIEDRVKNVYDWVRQIRGGVLGGAFNIERNISAAIVFFFLGDRAKMEGVQEAFDDAILGPMTFERRINAVAAIAPQLVQSAAAKKLCSDLSELKTLRNSMAHKPFWFVPQVNEHGRVHEVVPYIMRGKGPIALTSKLIEETNESIRRLIVQTQRLAESAALFGKAHGEVPS